MMLKNLRSVQQTGLKDHRGKAERERSREKIGSHEIMESSNNTRTRTVLIMTCETIRAGGGAHLHVCVSGTCGCPRY